MLLAWAASTLSGCSGETEAKVPELGMLELRQVVLPLLEERDHLAQRHLPEGERLNFDLFRPAGTAVGPRGDRRGIGVRAPATLVYELPDLPEGALLEYSTCVVRKSYVGTGEVDFKVRLNGEILDEATMSASESTPTEERSWRTARIPLATGGRLVLSATYEGDQETAPEVAFGTLEVVTYDLTEQTVGSPDEPNVILIVVDTLRADRLHAYGYGRDCSPNLDALAERGVLFEEAFAPTPWTSPSSTSIFTSLAPPAHRLGAKSATLSTRLTTIGEAFQRRGFRTLGVSANPWVSVARNFDQGFGTFVDFRWRRSPDLLDTALDWLEDNGDRRFFAYIHLVDPHFPYEPPEGFDPGFDEGLPVDFKSNEFGQQRDKLKRGKPVESPAVLESLARDASALYDAEIAAMDLALGEFFGQLEELGLLGSTVIAVTSDHGEEFLEHGLLGHTSQLHRESTRVPLIIAGPGIESGKRVDQGVEIRFVGPTLLHAIGMPPQDDLIGPNLLSAADRAAIADQPIFLTSNLGLFKPTERGVKLRQRDLHGVLLGEELMFWSPEHPGESAHALFDLGRDPEARRDIAHRETARVKELEAKIEGWLEANEALALSGGDLGEADQGLLEALGYVVGDGD